jgi:hypothetical protein
VTAAAVSGRDGAAQTEQQQEADGAHEGGKASRHASLLSWDECGPFDL